MSVKISKLPSGLHVVTDAMDTVETASIGAWVGIGARHERPEINGITHVLEHMAFKGTKRRSPQAIVEEIEAVGGHLNAYTSRENTAFFAKVLKDDVPLAVDIVADMLQYATIDAEELDRERQVIIQEINQANDTPDDIIFDEFNETAYPNQAIGRPVLGTAEIVGSLPRDEIVSYMRREYSAERIVIGAAGKIDHEAFVDLVSRSFTELPKGAVPKSEKPVYVGGEFREERDLDQAHLVLGFEGLAYDHPDYYALAVYSTLLGGGMSSRLFQEVREKRGLVYSIYSFASSFEDGGLFGIYAGTSEEQADEIIPIVADQMSAVITDLGVEEVKRAKAQLKASTLMSLESTSARSEQAARQLQIYGRPIPVAETIARIDEVDEATIRKVATNIVKSVPTLALIGPVEGLDSYDSVAKRFG